MGSLFLSFKPFPILDLVWSVMFQLLLVSRFHSILSCCHFPNDVLFIPIISLPQMILNLPHFSIYLCIMYMTFIILYFVKIVLYSLTSLESLNLLQFSKLMENTVLNCLFIEFFSFGLKYFCFAETLIHRKTNKSTAREFHIF